MSDVRTYRLTILLNPDASRDERGAVESLVSTWVRDRKGDVKTLAAEEKRKLAYDIAHKRQAVQIRAVFTAAGTDIGELLARLDREGNVLRTRLMRGERSAGKRLAEVLEKKMADERPMGEKPRGKPKVTLEKLDEKIEEILEEKVL